jgi:2-polyprenyl-3-methyl-5-hydroxy-6-metoxy-1,4-benzoquinol methylase
MNLEQSSSGAEPLFQKKCPLCSSIQIAKIADVSGYQVLNCNSCDLKWVPNVTNEQVSAFYDSTYYQGNVGYTHYLSDEPNIRINARTLLELLSAFKHDGATLLDVGCAHGFLLDEARKAGWKTKGTEISSEAGHYAKNKLRLDVFCGDLFEAGFMKDSFDAVTIIGSIEHLIQPFQYIDQMFEILKPGGYLIITTIDTKGLIPIYRLKPPEHLFYFTAANLKKACVDRGFTVKQSCTYWKKYKLAEALTLLFKALMPSFEWSIFHKLGLFDFNIKLPTNEFILILRKP